MDTVTADTEFAWSPDGGWLQTANVSRLARRLDLPDLPRTRSGKLVRRLVRDAVLGRDPGDATALANPESLEELKAVGA